MKPAKLWSAKRRDSIFEVFKFCKMCVYALCFTIVWKTYMLAEDGKQLMVVTQSSFHVLWQRDLIQFHRKSSNKTIIWLRCPFLFHDFLPQVTKRSLQNTWLNHPLLYKSSWMGITNPVFVQLHFLECFSQASARDSVYIIYRVCKCYQLFDISMKCYQEHLQIYVSSHIAKDVESKSSSSWTDPTQHSQVVAIDFLPIINNTFLTINGSLQILSFLLALNILSRQQSYPGARYLLGEEVVKRKVIVQLLLENQVLCCSLDLYKRHQYHIWQRTNRFDQSGI